MTTTTTEPGGDAPKRKAKEKPNGKANGTANGVTDEKVLPFPEPQEAEAAAAADGDEPDVDAYEPPEPSGDDLKIADEVFRNLDARAHEMKAQAVIDGLIQLVDVHKQFTTPQLFGTKNDDEEKFEPASVVSEIARLLCRGCEKLEVPFTKVAFVFKNHEKWTSSGQTVDAQVKRFDGFHQYMHEGLLAAVVVNYHHWKTLNPRQKVFVVYHALREMDGKGKRRAPDWGGYFEEPGLFGAGVHREMVTMARAFVKDAPDHVGEVYQLSILDEVYDD